MADETYRRKAIKFQQGWQVFATLGSAAAQIYHAKMTAPPEIMVGSAIAHIVAPVVFVAATHSVILQIRARRYGPQFVLSVFVTVFLGLAAFWLMFYSLRELAMILGMRPAWLWPVIIDASIAVSTLGLWSLTHRSRDDEEPEGDKQPHQVHVDRVDALAVDRPELEASNPELEASNDEPETRVPLTKTPATQVLSSSVPQAPREEQTATAARHLTPSPWQQGADDDEPAEASWEPERRTGADNVIAHARPAHRHLTVSDDIEASGYDFTEFARTLVESGRTKQSVKHVCRILDMHKAGYVPHAISERTGLNRGTVTNIINVSKELLKDTPLAI